MPADAPRVRIIHQMARCGGTLIAKCLGSMADIVLLSEVNPRTEEMPSRRVPSAIDQAAGWFGLLEPDEAEQFRHRPFPESIKIIQERCEQRGKYLVLRDWSHLDFTAKPFLPCPTYRLSLAEVLRPNFDLKRIATVRHPGDQYLSLTGKATGQGELTPETFLLGYFRFAKAAADIGFIRYEDFAASPENALSELCRALDLPYDPSFRERWPEYHTITGDNPRGEQTKTITPPARKPLPPDILARFQGTDTCDTALNLLGYDPLSTQEALVQG